MLFHGQLLFHLFSLAFKNENNPGRFSANPSIYDGGTMVHNPSILSTVNWLCTF